MALVIDNRRKPLELAIRKFIYGSYRVFDDIESRSAELQRGSVDLKTTVNSTRSNLLRGSHLFRDQISTLLGDSISYFVAFRYGRRSLMRIGF